MHPPDTPISVLVVDDHPLVLAGLVALIESEPSLALAGQAVDADSALAAFDQLRPAILLVDLHIPGGGLQAITRVRALHPAARIIVITASEAEEDVYRALLAGASGYLLKTADFEQIAMCIAQVVSGRNYLPPALAAKLAGRIKGNQLSPRELEILHYLSAGKSNKVIARVAGIGVGTVKYHVNNILSKLNVSCRTEAASVAVKRGLVHPY
ncbi:response regulator transcription factor [Massilia sp. S19_KUP03_FR1]|uniref:response regulator transcription factor n=1 Tax=Massilia sp. S19_KUP03_FR1 TaxID=3025503 RepID=UPI002FCCC7CC